MSERNELVARLQNETRYVELSRAAADAADQIERDGREIERLRGALIRIREASKFWAGDVTGSDAVRYAHESTLRLARAALNGEGETIIAVADEIMSDLSGYLDGSLTADDEMEAVDLVRRTIASTFSAPGWQPIETAPHEALVILGWREDGVWKQEIALASAGERLLNGYSNRWWHGQATHWMPLPAPPSEGVEP